MRFSLRLAAIVILASIALRGFCGDGDTRHFIYAAVPGIRDELQHGGHGVLVFEMDHEFKFVKRIPCHGVDEKGKPINVKGVCASKDLHCIFISTIKGMECIDLLTEKSLWEKTYDGGCDRMSISPDSKFMYLPSFEKDFWNVVDPRDGSVMTKVTPKSGAHNTVISLDGAHAYLGGLKSKAMSITDCKTHSISSTIEFTDMVRPFVVNGKGTLVYQCVNNLLGFEIGDVASGKMIHRLEVPNFKTGKVARHGCPSHGIGLSPNEKEVWVCDAFNKRMHVYDNTVTPPKYLESIEVRDEPGWITFSIGGKYAIPSTGDIIDAATRKIVYRLTDENNAAVASEKLLEIDLSAGDSPRVIAVGNQFSLGQVK